MNEYDKYMEEKRGDASTAIILTLLAMLLVGLATALWGTP